MTSNDRHAHLFEDDDVDSDRQSPASPHHTQQDSQQNGADVAELLSRRYRGVSIYMAIMVILVIGIVGTGIKIAEQTVQYRQDYQMLKNKEKMLNQLQIEHQRLLIEQQTFSATPQIAARAVAELRMYSPKLSEKLIVQPVSIKDMPHTTSMPTKNQPSSTKPNAGQQTEASSTRRNTAVGQ